MKCVLPVFMTCLLLVLPSGDLRGKSSGAGGEGEEEWKREFALVCGKTQNAMALSAQELIDYVARCDTLQDRLDELNGSQGAERKMYARRLELCRNLYRYMLEFKKEGN